MIDPDLVVLRKNTQAQISETLSLSPGLALSKLYDDWRVSSKEAQDIFVLCLIGELVSLRQVANLRTSTSPSSTQSGISS